MLRRRLPLLVSICCVCARDPAGGPESSTSTSSDPTSGTSTITTSSSGTTDTTNGTSGTSPTASTDGTTTHGASTHDTTATSTGAPVCTKHVVLMGYWPPTNEMLRPWSTNAAQNPDGWSGANWHGHGYDVHSFFPEFPPDGDPNNDGIGQDGAVGSPEFDLRVDYQATSADFWRIVDEYQPVILLTTSRGGDIGWEIEALEGGHGTGNKGDPSLDWSSDAHGDEFFPTESTIDPRSWDAITTHRQGATLPSQLPMQTILDATTSLALTTVAIDETDTSGNFLSGFLGLHGLYYQSTTAAVVAAGHIHVGYALPLEDASTLVEATLDAILGAHPSDAVACP